MIIWFIAIALGTTIFCSESAAAAPAKPAPKQAPSKKASAISNPADHDQIEFLRLAGEADKAIQEGKLDKARASADEIAKYVDKETESETKARMAAELHRIYAEVAIMEAKWADAENELDLVKKYSFEFAGEDTTGHFNDLLTLIHQKSGKSQAGPKLASDIDREYLLKTEMRALQLALEEYASNHSGKYPSKVEQLIKGYLDKFGTRFTNPFTKKEELPQLASKEELPQDTVIGKGKIFYRPTNDGDDYVIFGGGFDGKPILNERGIPFVLRTEDAPKVPALDAVGKHPHID
jgi:hypothetical protein